LLCQRVTNIPLPLTDKQRRACVIDEQHNLVLAGAGTGKTSTMIGRAGYLLKSGIARPQEILMLAFARKAADEMEERVQAKLGVSSLTVKTFHSLGKHIRSIYMIISFILIAYALSIQKIGDFTFFITFD
jgi:superfamily I DNA/RNA helicase